MTFMNISEALITLEKIPASNLYNHIADILYSEDSSSEVVIEIIDKNPLFTLILITKNAIENYWTMNIFYMDTIEKLQNKYRYFQFSRYEIKQLEYFLLKLIRKEKIKTQIES